MEKQERDKQAQLEYDKLHEQRLIKEAEKDIAHDQAYAAHSIKERRMTSVVTAGLTIAFITLCSSISYGCTEKSSWQRAVEQSYSQGYEDGVRECAEWKERLNHADQKRED